LDIFIGREHDPRVGHLRLIVDSKLERVAADKRRMPNTIARTLAFAVFLSTLADPSFGQSVRVPGTNVTVSPPEGFSLAKHYPGFEWPEAQASIMVTELPGPAVDMMRSITGPTLAGNGVMLISARDAVIREKPARLLHVRQKTPRGEALKWILITGDASTTIMIVGTFTEGVSPGVGDVIKQSLLTTSWGASASSQSSKH